MKTIFDLMGKKPKEEGLIEFDENINTNSKWICSISTSNDFSNCILISQDNNYKYYLCFNDLTNLSGTIIYRKKI